MANFPELAGKAVVVTGAARGIGEAIARRFAEEKSKVLLADLDRASVEKIAEDLGGEEAGFISSSCDVTDIQQVENMFGFAEREFGGVDVLVNNAGVAVVEPLMEADENSWEFQMSVNAKGVFLCTQVAARSMQKRGVGGRIIVNASGAGRTSPGKVPLGVYCASKHAAVGLTRAFADELAPSGILVNCICAGIVDTEMWELIDQRMTGDSGESAGKARDDAVATVPLGRIQIPADVANAVILLASNEASYITGQALSADGGLLKV